MIEVIDDKDTGKDDGSANDRRNGNTIFEQDVAEQCNEYWIGNFNKACKRGVFRDNRKSE